jgi:hypothetical protein
VKHSDLSCRCGFPSLLVSRGLTGHGVEIGVRRGDFSEIMMKSWPGTMHLVDPWAWTEEYVEVEAHPYEWRNDEDLEHVVHMVERYPGRGVIHKMTSLDASKVIADGLDFVYLDGNHALNHVWQDLRLWWAKIRPGGILAGHDFLYYPLPDVTQAVVEFAQMKRTTINLVRGSAADRNNCCVDGQVPSFFMVKD